MHILSSRPPFPTPQLMAPIRASKTPPVSPPLPPSHLSTSSPPRVSLPRNLRCSVLLSNQAPWLSSIDPPPLPPLGGGVLDGRRGGGVHHVPRGGRRGHGAGARHPGLPRRLPGARRRRRRRPQARRRRPAARQAAPAEAPEPAAVGEGGPQPLPGLRRRHGTVADDGAGCGLRRHHHVPQRVHDREGQDGAGAVRAREAAWAGAPPPAPAAQRRGRDRGRLPILLLGHHLIRQAPRRRCSGAGRRLRLPVRQRRRRGHGGRRLPALLPLRAHRPERPPLPALRVARAAAPGPGAQEEAPDRPQRRLPRNLAGLPATPTT